MDDSKRDKTIKLIAFYSLITTMVYVIISVGVFIYYFRKQHVIAEIQAWGTFGDYIGGIIGTFFAFLNVVVLYYLTITATRINNKINEIQIKQQSYQAYFNTINNMFFQVLNNYSKYRLSIVDEETENSERFQLEKNFEISIDLLSIFIGGILTELSEQISKKEKLDIDSSVKNLSSICKDLKNNYKDATDDKQSTLMKEFNENKSNLIRSINKYLKVESI